MSLNYPIFKFKSTNHQYQVTLLFILISCNNFVFKILKCYELYFSDTSYLKNMNIEKNMQN